MLVHSTVYSISRALCAPASSWHETNCNAMAQSVLHATCSAADPKIARQITVMDFNTWKDKTLPALDNPLLSGNAREAARSSMIIAK